MAQKGMYRIDFNSYDVFYQYGHSWSEIPAGKVVWNRNADINNAYSYWFITDGGGYGNQLTDNDVVVGVITNPSHGEWKYTAQEGSMGQHITINDTMGWSSNALINGTSLQDEIHINQISANMYGYSVGAGGTIVDAGDGDDKIYIETFINNNTRVDIRGGKGNDIFYINTSVEGNITGGDGADTYVINAFGTITDFDIMQDRLQVTKSLDNLNVDINPYDNGLMVGFTDTDGITATVWLQGLKDVSASKIKLVSGNTQATLGSVVALPTGLSYNADKTVLAVSSAYAGHTVNAADYSEKIKVINAQNTTKSIEIKGNDSANTILGGKNVNTLYGYGGNDTLKGGTGNDFIYGGTGNDALYGGKGDDNLYGGAGNNVFYFAQGDGTDRINDFKSGKDKIHYTSGGLSKVKLSGRDVLLYNDKDSQRLTGMANDGRQYADIVGSNGKLARHNFGGGEKDNKWNYISGQGYHGSAKVDTLNISGSTSYSLNLATASMFTSIDNVDASKAVAAMVITGGAEANALLGSNKNDTLKGGAGNDTIKGNAGNDKIYGDAGNDSLYGGKGNDNLLGGAGNDVFYYAQGDGNDTIADFEAGKDKIRYTSGSLGKVQISGKDVLLYNGAGYQKLAGKAVKGQYADIVGTNGKSIRHNFGKNGAANTWNFIAGQGYHGSSKADTLMVTAGTSANINLSTASLYTSIDNVDASDATATVNITGAAGANTLSGGKKNDTLKGGAGNDTLYGNRGNDVLYGGTGNDVFCYARDDGNDTIADFEAGKDKIRYTSGRLSKVQIAGKDVLLYNDAGYQKLVGKAAKGQYADIVSTDGKIVRHNFGTNATANTWSYVAGQGYHGSSKVDTLTITGAKPCSVNLANKSLYTSIDTVNASKAKADMTLWGSAEANTLIGGSEDDALYGGAGNDNLQGGNGDDELYAQSGNNILNGGAGDDYLYGGTDTDTLRGGTGNDIILGGRGIDKIQFYKGDGRDIILGANRKDVLYLYNVTNIESQVKLNLSSNNLVMSFNNNKNDSITLFNWSPSGLTKIVAGNKTYNLQLSGNKVVVK